jgi:hypothetical protein
MLTVFVFSGAAAASCITSISPNFITLDFFGGDRSFNVIAPPDCTYPITSNVFWASITNGSTGTGNKTVTFTVSFNNTPGFRSRGGAFVIDGTTYTIIQGGKGTAFSRALLDFNGDGNSDYAAIQNINGNMVWWFYHFHPTPGASMSSVTFGLFDQDVPAANDFDGDQKTDAAVWRKGATSGAQSYFYISLSGGGLRIVPLGTDGDNPNITQDFDGDTFADPAVARKQNGKLIWYILLSATNSVLIRQFGNEDDIPVRGDYDGDYHADIAVYRPNTGTPANTFFVLRSSDNTVTGANFGLSDIDKLVPGYYDSDNKTDFAVWRSTTGVWYWINSSNGAVNGSSFGQPGDLPVPAQYNGSRTDLAVWRPGASQGTFYIRNLNGMTSVPVLSWGNSSMKLPAYLVNSP